MLVKTFETLTAREKRSELLDEAANGGADIVITRDGQPVAAMIRYKDYAALYDELLRLRQRKFEVYQTMLASEPVLRREWNSPDEDEAWANL
jgi:prevent-host-death family protein